MQAGDPQLLNTVVGLGRPWRSSPCCSRRRSQLWTITVTPLEAALTLRVAGKKVATVRGSLWRIVGGFNFQWS